MKKNVSKEARRAEVLRAYKAAEQMYACALNMLELAQKCADDYELNDQEMREVILSPILIFILKRKGLTIEEQRALMKLMINQAGYMFEEIIGPLFVEEDNEKKE